MNASQHRWKFVRLGGFDQVRLETVQDIEHLAELDQKLWAALSCPVHGLEFDERTLALLDGDADGRVRVPEILAAARWVVRMLKDKNLLMTSADTVPLDAIDDSQPEGRRLLAAAKQILGYLGKTETRTVGIEDVANTETLLQGSKLNGDGVITPTSTDNPELSVFIGEIMACVGCVEDRSGEAGVGMDQVAAFFDATGQYAAWHDDALAHAATILPLDDDTHAAVAIFQSLRPKINDYFTRCGLAAFDPKAQEALNPALQTYESIATHDLSVSIAELEQFPLGRIEAGRALPLTEGINPVWAGPIKTFRERVVLPLLGDIHSLDASQWTRLLEIFAPHETWLASKAGAQVEGLGIERVRAVLGSSLRQDVESLIAEDQALAEQTDSLMDVTRLVHYTRDLLPLLNNFVAFRDFYAQDRKAIFQAGTLYLDGRACELCVRVANPDAHATLASLGQTYLAYCLCTRRDSVEQMFIAAAFTNGDADNLMVGRNGVFYDRKGQDWDATIIKIIDHPISVRQAFWSPYKRVARMIGAQIEKFAAAKDKAVSASAEAKIATPTPGAAKTPFDVGKFAGIFAAIGLALGAIGTAVATVLGGFLSLPLWQMPLTIGGVMLLISGPSMLIAYLKLGQRNLGPILDACGWAVNTKASINIPFGTTLTTIPELPQGAERSPCDPFAEKKTPWKRWAVLVALLVALGMAWDKGYIQSLTHGLMYRIQTTTNATRPAPTNPNPGATTAAPATQGPATQSPAAPTGAAK